MRPLALALSICALFISGCGEPEVPYLPAPEPDAPSSIDIPLTQEEYETQIKSILAGQRAAKDDVDNAIIAAGYPPGSAKAIAFSERVNKSLAPVFRESVKQLKAITPPLAVSELHKDLIKVESQIVGQLRIGQGIDQQLLESTLSAFLIEGYRFNEPSATEEGRGNLKAKATLAVIYKVAKDNLNGANFPSSEEIVSRLSKKSLDPPIVVIGDRNRDGKIDKKDASGSLGQEGEGGIAQTSEPGPIFKAWAKGGGVIVYSLTVDQKKGLVKLDPEN